MFPLARDIQCHIPPFQSSRTWQSAACQRDGKGREVWSAHNSISHETGKRRSCSGRAVGAVSLAAYVSVSSLFERRRTWKSDKSSRISLRRSESWEIGLRSESLLSLISYLRRSVALGVHVSNERTQRRYLFVGICFLSTDEVTFRRILI